MLIISIIILYIFPYVNLFFGFFSHKIVYFMYSLWCSVIFCDFIVLNFIFIPPFRHMRIYGTAKLFSRFSPFAESI